MVQVRQLLPCDSIEALTALLHRAYARLGEAGLNYTAVDQALEVTVARISGGACFVAVSGERLVGTIVVQPPCSTSHCEVFTRKDTASAHQFAVDPDFQGSGVGRALLARAEQWAADAGFVVLALDTAVTASHLVAMYSRLGYGTAGLVQWPGKNYRSVVLGKAIGRGVELAARADTSRRRGRGSA